MTERYLSMTEVAERLGITKGALARYRLPDPDVVVGKARGWREDTIDQWNAPTPRPQVSAEEGHANTPNNKKKPLPSNAERRAMCGQFFGSMSYSF